MLFNELVGAARQAQAMNFDDHDGSPVLCTGKNNVIW